MQVGRFDVYEIDGTLTIPSHDFWYLCTRSLCADKDLFDKYVAEWKRGIQIGADPFDCSLTSLSDRIELVTWPETEAMLASQRPPKLSKNVLSHRDERLVCSAISQV
jgi:hypothetical protein